MQASEQKATESIWAAKPELNPQFLMRLYLLVTSLQVRAVAKALAGNGLPFRIRLMTGKLNPHRYLKAI